MYFIDDTPPLITGTPFPDMFEQGNTCRFGKYLFQGDIINLARDEARLFNKQEGAVGYLVVSNSCDLQNKNDNARPILLAPIYPFDYWYKRSLKKTLTEKDINNELLEEIKYNKKDTFFISPLEQLGNKPLIAFIADIKSIRYNINFNWDEIPGRDNRKLEDLFRVYNRDLAENINIQKIDDNTIILVTEKNSVLLILNKEKQKRF